MNILIIGANGRVGTQLAQILAEQGHIVHAAARRASPDWAHENIRHQALDLTAPLADISQIVAAIRPDAVYFTAGSRGKNLLQVDAFGAVKAMQAAKANGVQRFILLSSVFALQPERWGENSWPTSPTIILPNILPTTGWCTTAASITPYCSPAPCRKPPPAARFKSTWPSRRPMPSAMWPPHWPPY